MKKKWVINKNTSVGFGAALALLLGIGTFSYINFLNFKKADDWVEHTLDVDDTNQKLFNLVVDAETGQRDYLLTNKELYLQPYYLAKQQILGKIQHLRELTSDNPNQQRRVDNLENLIAAKVAELQQTIELRRSKGLNAVLQVINTDRGKQLMENIRVESTQIADEENELLKKRSQEQLRIVQTTTWLTLAGSAICFGLVLKAIDLVNGDIHKRLQTEEELKESQKRFRRLVESNIIGVVFSDFKGNIHYANDYFLNLLGYTQGDLQAGEITRERITPSEFLPLDAQATEQLITQGNSTPYQKEYLRKDGSRVPILIGTALLQEPYHQQQEMVAFILDLTELQQIQADLLLNQAYFRMLLDNIQDYAIFFLDTEGCVISWGAGAKNIFGYQEEEIIGCSASIIFTPEDREQGKDKKEFNKALAEGRAEDECWHIRKDGTRFWASGILTSLRDQRGQPQGFVKIARDFTERKQAEKEREELLDREQAARVEAEKTNRIKDEFLATLSHELRTPLNAMLGWTTLLRGGMLDRATSDRALETIERNTKSLNQLIEDILDVSRIITGKLLLQVEPVELIPVIEGAIETVRPAAESKKIQIETQFDASNKRVLGDPNRLQQIVWNLLANAVKFTPKKGRVWVQLEFVDSCAQIRVRDTGIGIAPEFLPYVFDRFRQADSSTTRNYGGLGLGLSIVRHLVELHGGTVKAESLGAGQGTTFIVDLPIAAVTLEPREPEQLEFPTSTEEVPNPLPSLAGLRVLVVDDEPDARDLVATVLKSCGAEVIIASSAAEAFAILKEYKPDLLLSDIGMPQEDGYSLIRKIRNLDAEQGGKIPAVALTAYARDEDRNKALSAGFQLHIPKPVNSTKLANLVATLAGKS